MRFCVTSISLSIIYDRGAQLTSRFWRSFQEKMGTKVNLSTALHHQTLEDMFRACIIQLEGNGDTHLALVEFGYNNSFHSSIFLAPYDALYGRR